MPDHDRTLRLAALADIHLDRSGNTQLKELFTYAEQHADILALCGDLTDYGLPEEAKLLAAELHHHKTPVVAVLGNHDYQSGNEDEVIQILSDAGVRVLDGQAWEYRGVGFAGAKGFGGGFGVHTLEPWGERAIKRFVQESLDEAMKLEMALSRLRTQQRIALLHYSPVAATVAGEPPEIFPYLGSSRLEEPLNRYQVQAVFHGHAHRGCLEGTTREGIPVYNVSMSLLRRSYPDQLPLRIYEVPLPDGVAEANGSGAQKSAAANRS